MKGAALVVAVVPVLGPAMLKLWTKITFPDCQFEFISFAYREVESDPAHACGTRANGVGAGSSTQRRRRRLDEVRTVVRG